MKKGVWKNKVSGLIKTQNAQIIALNCEGPRRRKTPNEKTTTEFIFSVHVEKIQEQFEPDKINTSNILHNHYMALQHAPFFPATTNNPKKLLPWLISSV